MAVPRRCRPEVANQPREMVAYPWVKRHKAGVHVSEQHFRRALRHRPIGLGPLIHDSPNP